MSDELLEQVRALATALPEVNERASHGAPCFVVRDKRPICYYHDVDFGDSGRASIWCPAPDGVQEELVTTEPETFFRPTPSASGVFGTWVGMHLDDDVDWDLVNAVLVDAYRLVAPKRLVAQLES